MGTELIITGKPEKEPKINDNFAELIFRSSMIKDIPYLSNLGESIYLVRISKLNWSNIENRYSENSSFTIKGEPKACVNKKGIPYITVNCTYITIHDLDTIKTDNTSNTNNRNVSNAWYKNIEDQLVTIDLENVILTERNHLEANTISITGLDKAKRNGLTAPIAVRKLENGKYSLVAGYKPFIQARLLNIKSLKAYITKLNHDEFVLEFNIDKSKKQYSNKIS